MEPRLKIEVVS